MANQKLPTDSDSRIDPPAYLSVCIYLCADTHHTHTHMYLTFGDLIVFNVDLFSIFPVYDRLESNDLSIIVPVSVLALKFPWCLYVRLYKHGSISAKTCSNVFPLTFAKPLRKLICC